MVFEDFFLKMSNSEYNWAILKDNPDLTSLQVLVIRQNHFYSSIPNSICKANLKLLWYINIGSNDMIGTKSKRYIY